LNDVTAMQLSKKGDKRVNGDAHNSAAPKSMNQKPAWRVKPSADSNSANLAAPAVASPKMDTLHVHDLVFPTASSSDAGTGLVPLSSSQHSFEGPFPTSLNVILPSGNSLPVELKPMGFQAHHVGTPSASTLGLVDVAFAAPNVVSGPLSSAAATDVISPLVVAPLPTASLVSVVPSVKAMKKSQKKALDPGFQKGAVGSSAPKMSQQATMSAPLSAQAVSQSSPTSKNLVQNQPLSSLMNQLPSSSALDVVRGGGSRKSQSAPVYRQSKSQSKAKMEYRIKAQVLQPLPPAPKDAATCKLSSLPVPLPLTEPTSPASVPAECSVASSLPAPQSLLRLSPVLNAITWTTQPPVWSYFSAIMRRQNHQLFWILSIMAMITFMVGSFHRGEPRITVTPSDSWNSISVTLKDGLMISMPTSLIVKNWFVSSSLDDLQNPVPLKSAIESHGWMNGTRYHVGSVYRLVLQMMEPQRLQNIMKMHMTSLANSVVENVAMSMFSIDQLDPFVVNPGLFVWETSHTVKYYVFTMNVNYVHVHISVSTVLYFLSFLFCSLALFFLYLFGEWTIELAFNVESSWTTDEDIRPLGARNIDLKMPALLQRVTVRRRSGLWPVVRWRCDIYTIERNFLNELLSHKFSQNFVSAELQFERFVLSQNLSHAFNVPVNVVDTDIAANTIILAHHILSVRAYERKDSETTPVFAGLGRMDEHCYTPSKLPPKYSLPLGPCLLLPLFKYGLILSLITVLLLFNYQWEFKMQHYIELTPMMFQALWQELVSVLCLSSTPSAPASLPVLGSL